jgi:hypothetical protein
MRYVAFCLIGLAVGCNRSSGPGPIELGHLYTTGTREEEFRGLDLAHADVNQDVGRLPERRALQVRNAPAGPTADSAAAQGTRLVALNKTRGLIGPSHAGFAERVGTVTQAESGVVLGLSGWTGSPAVANLFALGVAPAERGRVLALTAKHVLGGKSGNVLIVRDPAAVSANAAADRFASDCRAFATVTEARPRPKAPEADVVFFATPAAVALEHRGSHPTATILFGDEEAELPALLSGGDGFVVVTPYDLAETTGRTAEFAKRYREKFHHEPTTAAALAYDAFTLWAEVAHRADGYDPPAIRTELLKRDKPFESLSGPLVFADDHTARRKVFVARIKDGVLKTEAAHEPESSK